MSAVNPIIWTGERNDPSPVGRGSITVSSGRKLGLGAAALLLLATIVAAVLLPEHRWLVLGVGVVATVVVWFFSAGTPHDAGPKTYHRREGWALRETTPQDLLACHNLMSKSDDLVAKLPDCPKELSVMAEVQRPAGTGNVAVTAPSTHRVARNNAATIRSRMVVWVPLPAALPAMWLATVAPPGTFETESVDFNTRYAPMRWTIPGTSLWDQDEFSAFASNFFSPRVMQVLVDAFPGMPELLVRGSVMGAVIEPEQPHRAELTLDVLLSIRELLPGFLFEHYAQRAALEG